MSKYLSLLSYLSRNCDPSRRRELSRCRAQFEADLLQELIDKMGSAMDRQPIEAVSCGLKGLGRMPNDGGSRTVFMSSGVSVRIHSS
jgi:hypothetical protein